MFERRAIARRRYGDLPRSSAGSLAHAEPLDQPGTIDSIAAIAAGLDRHGIYLMGPMSTLE